MEWALLACGALLLATSLLAPALERLPVSTAMIYLGAGVAAGPLGLGWLEVDPVADAGWLEPLAEAAVLLSLFVTGLKIDTRLGRREWRAATLLATLAMVLTIAGAALAAHALLGLPAAAALLVAAVLAPTDPVLAAEIQVRDTADRDALRVALSGEAGLNDGTAFPFVMLALGLAGAHELGAFGWRWWTLDVAWAVAAGLGVGWGVGRVVGALAARRQGERTLSEFVAVGTIAAAYGAAMPLKGYGFLAVFAAALAVRRALDPAEPTTDDGRAPDAVRSVLRFNGQLERIGEFVLVVVVGAALASVQWSWALVGFAAVLLGVIRPLAVAAALRPLALSRRQRRLAGWFGLRGIGSVYYLAFAFGHAGAQPWNDAVASAVLGVIALSVVVHGVSVTPLMLRYERHRAARRR